MSQTDEDSIRENEESNMNHSPGPQHNNKDKNLKSEKDTTRKDSVSTMSDEDFQRAVRKVKAQAQIDAIMDGPDAPFDLSSELKKVLTTSGIDIAGSDGKPTALQELTPKLTPEEYAIEEMVHDVESSMYNAASEGNFDEAQSKKQELNRMHMDDSSFVLEANWRFYKAFSEKDYDAMEALWLHDASALCIHPSHAPLLGANDVLKSFSQMFASGNKNFQRNKMEPTNIRLSVKGTTAIITCDEEVYTKRFVRGRKRIESSKRNGDSENATKNGMELVNRLIATNIFRKVSGKWKMVYHHSSWHAESDAAKNALNAQISSPSTTPTTNSVEDNLASDITAEGVLGIPGHEGLNQRSSSVPGAGPNGENPIAKRTVFTGSLSDFLNGGLGDILGNSKDQGEGSIGSSGEIHFGNMNDDDDEEDDETGEALIIQNGSIVVPDGNEKTQSKRKKSREKLRQKCIASLRNLAAKGVISQKQKRMLLTDVIMSSGNGESSMVETAYELLCAEPFGDDKDGLEEDFADQCRVFASTLPDFPPPKTF